MGCEVVLGETSVWAKPLELDWKKLDFASIAWDNGWLDAMQAHTAAAIEASGGRYPVGPCHLRDLGDLASVLIGQNEFCLALYDHPEDVRRLNGVCMKAWQKIVRAQYELLSTEAGGYWNGNQPLWSPGKSMFIPADVASLVSPEMFAEFFLEALERMLGGVDFCILHTHSTYLDAYPMDLLMQIAPLRAVQVGIDEGGPSAEELVPRLRAIQKSRPLIVAGVLSPEDVRILRSKLPPEGLCLLSYLETIADCKELIDDTGIG